MPKTRVLIVEDDREFAELVSLRLEENGLVSKSVFDQCLLGDAINEF